MASQPTDDDHRRDLVDEAEAQREGDNPMTPEIEKAREAAAHLPYGDPTRELLTKLANRIEEQEKLVHELRGELQRLTSADDLNRTQDRKSE